jgi:plasmid stabilization system protein ParE
MSVRFLSLANQEVDDAVRWYDEQAEGLSRAFLDELDRAVRLVRIYPLMATEIEPEIHRLLFSRFPFSLIYGID